MHPPAHRRLRIAVRTATVALWVVAFLWMWRLWESRQSQQPPRSRQLPAPQAPVFQPWELPDFELIDQNGRPVRKADLLGRQWVASFVFTRCTKECPMISSRMQTLQDELGATDARIVTITVDPENDTPAVLKRYAQGHTAKPGRWLFLTGPRDAVYRLLHDGFKVTAKQNTGKDRQPGEEVSHSQRVLHVDEAGRVIGTYNGLSADAMESLRQAIARRAKSQ